MSDHTALMTKIAEMAGGEDVKCLGLVMHKDTSRFSMTLYPAPGGLVPAAKLAQAVTGLNRLLVAIDDDMRKAHGRKRKRFVWLVEGLYVRGDGSVTIELCPDVKRDVPR